MAKISMDLIKELREKTLVGMMDCKKALEETNGDLEKAIELLRKKGADIASKRADKETNNGRIEAYVADDFQSGAIVEVACETDFSANTDAMKEFALFAAKNALQEKTSNPEELLTKSVDTKKMLDELLAKIAERISISKIALLEVTERGIVNHYIHPGSQVGVIIELATENECSNHIDELKSIARNVCMHIAVRCPLAVVPQELDQDVVAKERSIIEEQLKAANKPANMIEKITEGKINKFYKEVCLLNQPFIKNEDQNIESYLKEQSEKLGNAITIKRFSHFVIGQ